MVWGQIAAAVAPAVIGGVMGNRAAKQQNAAAARRDAMQMMPYTDAQPYITDLYSRGQGALDSALQTGAYTGPTLAQMNRQQRDAIGMGEASAGQGYQDAMGFMGAGRGFANNYGDIYNQASQDMLGNAIDYASQNVSPLLRAAMQDDVRNFEENQLTGVGLSASGSGNTNSSRRGTREAILERGLKDREADTAIRLQDMLINRSLGAQQNRLGNMMDANANLANTYNTGFAQSGVAADRLNTAGGMLRADEQAQLDDDRNNFERQRDFEMGQLTNYNAGILGRTPTSIQPLKGQTANPAMAGLSGAMMGFGFGQQYGGDIANMFRPQAQPQVQQASGLIPQQGSRGMGFGRNPYGF